MSSFLVLFVLLQLLICGVVSLRANEFLRPSDPAELIYAPDERTADRMLSEEAIRVQGVKVAWADYDLIRRDFPSTASYSSLQIDSWLIENFGYVGDEQPKLNQIRNSTIPMNPLERKKAYRPGGWDRSAVLEAKASDGRTIGMVDIKGLGHGARTREKVARQIEKFLDLEKRGEITEIDRFRTKGHSDGLMSFGEAIAETTRQIAVQRLSELTGIGLETVESYAILVPPFRILKSKGQSIPAAYYLRQAHQGRTQLGRPSGLPYIDHAGGSQVTRFGTAVDFGGVVITDPRLQATFGLDKGDDSSRIEDTKPWRWGHDTAEAWVRGDHDAVFRHINEMLADISEEYAKSVEVDLHRVRQAQTKALLDSNKNGSFEARARQLFQYQASRDGADHRKCMRRMQDLLLSRWPQK